PRALAEDRVEIGEVAQGEADRNAVECPVAKRKTLAPRLHVPEFSLLAAGDQHADARVESDHRVLLADDLRRCARNHPSAGRDVEDPIAPMQSRSRQSLAAIPVAGAEREKRDRPVVPRSGPVEEIANEVLAFDGMSVELP